MKLNKVSFGVILSLVLTGFASGQSAAQWIAQCSDSLAKKNYQEAVFRCTKAIAVQPDSVEAFQLRAEAHEKMFYYAAATADYSALIQLTKGAAKFHFYRAEIYSLRAENKKAIDDYTAVITKEPKGSFTAKSFYGRGLIFDKVGSKSAAQADYENALKLDPGYTEAKQKLGYPFGDLTITQAADRIVPGIPPTSVTAGKGAEVKPKPSPTSSPTIGVKTTPAKVPADWKRTVLTGTGLSVASPIPFKLERSEPLASIGGTVEAEVAWKFVQGGLRAYVEYTKEDKGYKAVRQHLEDNIQYLLNNAKSVESLIHDTKFLGETGAFYDEVEFEPSSNKSMRRKVLVFGGPIAYRRILHIFPADDTAAALLSSQIIASFKNEGSLAVGKSKFPPLEWKLYNFGGVLFEFPAKPSEKCKADLPERFSQTCAVWGDNLVNLHVTYATYPPSIKQQTAMQAAEEYVKSSKELEISTKAAGRSDYRIAVFPINIGEAALVIENSGFTTHQIVYIRRGNATWQVRISHTMMFDQAKLVGERATRSIKFKN